MKLGCFLYCVFLQIVFSFAAIAGAVAKEKCETTLATYTVKVVDADTFSVEARFMRPTSRLDVFAFPIKERPEGQAESILHLQGFDKNSNPVSLNFVGEGGWETPDSQQIYRITYQVRADHDEVDWGGVGGPGKDEVATHFDDTYFFAGHAFFLIDFDWPACPIEVIFDLPDNWLVTSPWPIQDNVARALNPWNLAQNVFAMGSDKAKTVQFPGMEITWLISSEVSAAESRISALMSALPDVYADFFGGAPGAKFTTFFFGDYMSDGGAFENSFAMRLATPLSKADEIVWTHTLGHEVMHLWNGAGAIQSANPEQTNWFTEGFTDYLTIKLMRKAGFVDDEMLQQRLANILRRYEISKRLTPKVKLLEAGKDKADNWFLIYGGGALTALVLDGELSKADPNAFQEVMRDIYNHSDEPYTLDRLLTQMNTTTDGKAGEVIDWIDSKPSAAKIRQRLSGVGLDMTNFGLDEFYVAFPECVEINCSPEFLGVEK